MGLRGRRRFARERELMIIPAISGERRSMVFGTLRFSCKDSGEPVDHGGHDMM